MREGDNCLDKLQGGKNENVESGRSYLHVFDFNF